MLMLVIDCFLYKILLLFKIHVIPCQKDKHVEIQDTHTNKIYITQIVNILSIFSLQNFTII